MLLQSLCHPPFYALNLGWRGEVGWGVTNVCCMITQCSNCECVFYVLVRTSVDVISQQSVLVKNHGYKYFLYFLQRISLLFQGKQFRCFLCMLISTIKERNYSSRRRFFPSREDTVLERLHRPEKHTGSH